MSGLKACVELLDNSTPAPQIADDAAELMKRGVVAILELAEIEGGLPCTYPWELAPSTRRALTKRSDWTPPGGWAALSAMMAACGILESESSVYRATLSAGEITLIPAERLRRRMLEAFTCWLAPPAPAAHLFVSLNMHPLWGLKLVSAIDSPHHRGIPSVVSTAVMPDEFLEPARKVVFGTIGIIVAALRRLDPERAYEVEALNELATQASLAMLELVDAQAIEHEPGQLRLFIGDPRAAVMQTVQHQTWRELFQDVFVASGALRIGDNGRFQVAPGAFDELVVDRWEDSEQDQWLSHMTGTEARFLKCAS